MTRSLAPAKLKPIPVLVVSPCPEDHDDLHKMLCPAEWQVLHAASWPEAERVLRTVQCPLVITESDLNEWCWRKVLASLDRMRHIPKPNLIVVSEKADDYLWSEVLNLGGYDVLAKPLDKRELLWVLKNALDEIPRHPVRSESVLPEVAAAVS